MSQGINALPVPHGPPTISIFPCNACNGDADLSLRLWVLDLGDLSQDSLGEVFLSKALSFSFHLQQLLLS